VKPSAHALVGECLSRLSSYYENADAIAESRASFTTALSKLEETVFSGGFAKYDDAWDAFALQPFFLTYQGQCDKELLQRWGAILAHIASEKYPQYLQQRSLADCKRKDGKISVAFFSHSFSNHADWKMITSGWVDQLPRDRFNLIGYSSSMNSDWITGVARTKFDAFVQEPDFDRLCERIASDRPHVLIYLETGISPISMRLASLRLAPVQCATWGKAGTSGLPTIDYFLSSDSMEPESADSHYSEKLVRLANTSSYYVPQVVEARGGRDESVTRYLCVQSLFKFLPQHDELLCRIASNVKNAEFVFTSRPEGLAHKVRTRLTRAFAAHGLDSEKHLKFVPSLGELEYAELCASSSAFLDTMMYSGCTTTIEALQQNLPVITLAGALMRGRHSAAMLQLMQLDELIARDENEYVEKATWLGLDRAWHSEMSQAIASRKNVLFRDRKPVEELEKFLQTVTS
jgi:predicted O-linked N-acetylglucosamine transferase (SPINDLY family)